MSERGFPIRRILKVVLPVIVIAVGATVAGGLIATRPQAQRVERPDLGAPVTVQVVAREEVPITVHARGTVTAARQVILQPEVSGRVVWQSPALIPGGRARAGEVLLRVDSRDFRANVEQQAAQVTNSDVALAQERSRQRVARREWEILESGGLASVGAGGAASEPAAGGAAGSPSGDGAPEGRALAMREPQLESAEAARRAAQSRLTQARLSLARTALHAPFDGIVITESAELGQLVGPAGQLATFVGTDSYWVRVSVPVERLSWILIPGINAELGGGAPVRVTQHVGDGVIERSGRVIQLLGDLDPVGRMARLIVEIDDPLGLRRESRERGEPGDLPLLLGSFVEVEIDAGSLEGVVKVPRTALRNGTQVYLFENDRLAIREVAVTWGREEDVLIRSGIEPGEQLIVGLLPNPVEGMRLRIADAGATTGPAGSGSAGSGSAGSGSAGSGGGGSR